MKTLPEAQQTLVMFPNCHECPEASGMGNLTKLPKIFGKTCPIAQGDELVQQDPSPDTARQIWPWQIKVLICCNIVQLCNCAFVQDTLKKTITLHGLAYYCTVLVFYCYGIEQNCMTLHRGCMVWMNNKYKHQLIQFSYHICCCRKFHANMLFSQH